MSLEEEIDKLTIQDPDESDVTSCPSSVLGQSTNTDETTTETTSPETTVRRHVSNSSLFENDQHLFDFIDDNASGNKSVVKDKEEHDEEENSLERGPSVTFNFLDEDTLDSKSNVTDDDEEKQEDYKFPEDEQTHEEYFIGCPEDKSLMGPPDHLHRDSCCRSETPVSGGRSSKGRAPPPPPSSSPAPDDSLPVPPPGYFCEGSQNCQFSIPVPHKNHYHICPQFNTYNYSAQPQAKVRFYQVGYNTNWRKMPQNWMRMKSRYHAKGGEDISRHHARYSHYHYGYGKSWLSYAFAPLMIPLRYSLPSSWRSRKEYFHHFTPKSHGGMKDFDHSLCMCCVCCNCAKTNQGNCCCCYHCVHTTSSCRRSDILRMVPVPYASPGTGAIVSILKKKNVDASKIHPSGEEVDDALQEFDQTHLEQQEFHPDNKPSLSITGPDLKVIRRDDLDSEGNENGFEGDPMAPSPSISGPTPTTEPTDLEEVASIIL